jgi:hypothetical protein
MVSDIVYISTFGLVPGVFIPILLLLKRKHHVKKGTPLFQVLIFSILSVVVILELVLSVLGFFGWEAVELIGIGVSSGTIFLIFAWNLMLKTLRNQESTILSQSRNLMDILVKVQETANQLSSSSEELASTSEEVSSSSENVAATQQQITKGAQSQAQMVVETQKLIQLLGDGIKKVQKNATDISQVVDIITSIANQTNLLALNAAIEAARAGEAGRGFTVVADQVRKLADESKQAVQRTEVMAGEILREADAQAKSAVNVVSSVDSIATVAEETSASTEEASAAAEEQASSMEEITSTAQSLAELAANLKNLVDLSGIIDKSPASSIESANLPKPDMTSKSPKLVIPKKSLKKEVHQDNKGKVKREIPPAIEETPAAAPTEKKSSF